MTMHKYEDLVNTLWHWVVDDGLGFVFGAGMLRQNYGYDEKMTARVAKSRFKKYFKDMTGYEVYVKCPKCEKGELLPREGAVGSRFVGCSEYPECKFNTLPKKKEKKEEKEKPKWKLVKPDESKIKIISEEELVRTRKPENTTTTGELELRNGIARSKVILAIKENRLNAYMLGTEERVVMKWYIKNDELLEAFVKENKSW